MAAKEEMAAGDLLKADHRKVEELFEKFESARGAKQEIAEKVCMMSARKEELMQEYTSGLPTPQTRSFKRIELDYGEPVDQAA